MENEKLRLKARGSGVPFWKIAKELKISEPTLTRRLREPLKDKDYIEILTIIERLQVFSDGKEY